jgi:DNA-binding response OmpR family regulator
MRLHVLVVESDVITLALLDGFLADDAGMKISQATNISGAKDAVRQLIAKRGPLDVVIVADFVEDGSGLVFIEWLRGLPDEYVCAGGLRVKHVPVIMLSASFGDVQQRWLHDVDESILKVTKPFKSGNLLRAVDFAIGRYRHEVMVELDRAGLAVTYDDGRFRVLEGFLTRPLEVVQTKLLHGNVDEAGLLCRRLVLSAERARVGSVAVDELEDLLNDKKSTETVLHDFFERHPEFLADQGYSWYWSELTLRNETTSMEIRPDFILRPLVARIPWDWHVLDLKSPHVKLTSYDRFHRDWSSHVHHVVRQLRNYRNFFRDQRNREILSGRFGGVIPRPRLTAVIGKDYSEISSVADLVDDLVDVRIRTYDEILTFSREQIQRLRAALGEESWSG